MYVNINYAHHSIKLHLNYKFQITIFRLPSKCLKFIGKQANA